MKAAQSQAKYETMGGKDLEKELKLLEKQMLDAAKNLEFEKAARLRTRETAGRHHSCSSQ
jgi:excinuclease ABC subunit B